MNNKKSFLLGFLTGILVMAIVGGVTFGIWYSQNFGDMELEMTDGEFDVSGEEIMDGEAAGVFAENGNPIITDVNEKYKIEVAAPEGFVYNSEFESAYAAEFTKEGTQTGIAYTIENYTAEEMKSYYEFDVQFMETSEGGEYTNVSTSDVQTMEINGYTVNYLEFSYTFEEKENYTEYCSYVMLDDGTEFTCTIYGVTGEVNPDMLKDFYNIELPISK